VSERLADIHRRITSIQQLGAVVNAMRGIAGARAQQAHSLLPAIHAYAATAADAIGRARQLLRDCPTTETARSGPALLVAFGAEQGFAGAYAERVIEAVSSEAGTATILLIGTRAAAIADERQVRVEWRRSLPERAAAVPALATTILEAVFERLAATAAARLDIVFPMWIAGQGSVIQRRTLLPFDATRFPLQASPSPVLVNLSPADLIDQLGQEFLFAQLCEAGLEAFSAENEARVETMAAAKRNIDQKLQDLATEEKLTRQEEITAEVIELAGGARTRWTSP